MKRISITLAITVMVLGGLLEVCRADEAAELVRRLLSRHSPSAVTLSLVIKVSAGEFGDDQVEREVDGLLLDSTGLVVTTNAAIDPASLVEDMTSEGYTGTVASRIVSLKILTASGDELPAKVVLRDKDRNLAFVRPTQAPATTLTPIDFKTGGKAQVGDPIYILSRLGKVGNRSPVITTERIVSIIERPQMLYVILPNMFASLGNIVFNEQGEPLGMLSLRYRGGRGGLSSGDYLPVVIPAADVWEVAQQAPQAKDVKDVETTSKPPPKKPSISRTTTPPKPAAPPARRPPGRQPAGKQPTTQPAGNR